MSTSTPINFIANSTTSNPAEWIWHKSFSSASAPRHIYDLEFFIDNMFGWYTWLMALLLPIAILIFFFTPPDREFRPQELDDMAVEEELLETGGTRRDEESSDVGSMEGEADSGSDCASGSGGVRDAGSEADPDSHSDRDWDNSPEEWIGAEQQPNTASCCPQYTAWARDLNPEYMD